jgi:hypothetical protein
LAGQRDGGNDELATALCDDSAIARSCVCGTYFDDAEVTIEL